MPASGRLCFPRVFRQLFAHCRPPGSSPPCCCLLQKLLGATWRPAHLPPNTRVISLDEYKRAKGWA